MPVILPLSLQDDEYTHFMWAWQARVGIGPTFGSRPVGWYQIHHSHAMDLINATIPTGAKGIRLRKGYLELLQGGEFRRWMTPGDLYRAADTLSRQ